MKVIDHIKNASKTLFTFEILPPLKGKNIQQIYDTVEKYLEFNPAFINITYHRDDTEFITQKDGSIVKKTVRKRPGTVAIAAALQFKYKIDIVPHLICGNFSKDQIENFLVDLNYLGIENILALRGDSGKTEKSFTPHADGNAHATELIQQISNMNKGKYIDSELKNTSQSNFCIGCAGYPEKHFESPNLDTDIRYVKDKVDAGAEYIVTQMFFDNAKYFSFVEKCRNAGITVPIIPGLKPIHVKNQLTVLPQIFHIDLPQDLVTEVEKCTSDEQVAQVGVEWGIQQTKELIAKGAPVVHFYTLGNAENIKKVVKASF